MKSQATAGIFLVSATMSLIGDACGIFHNQCGGMLARRMYGTARPDILEVFGGNSEVSMQASRQGWFAMQPYDVLYGTNLRDGSQRAELRSDIARMQPRLVIVELPCTPWCGFKHVQASKSQKARRQVRQQQLRDRPFLELAEDIFKDQLARGDHALLENPWNSMARKEPAIKRIEADKRCISAYCDQCMFNARHAESGLHIKKPTVFVCTSPEMAQELSRKCDRQHVHDTVQGRATSSSARYTRELARGILRGLRRTLQREEPGRLAQLRQALQRRITKDKAYAHQDSVNMFTSLDECQLCEDDATKFHECECFAVNVDSEGIRFELRPEDNIKASPVLKNAIKRMHINTGHSAPHDMARVIKQAGG